jgi:tannase
MRSSILALSATSITIASAASLTEVCNSAYVQASLPTTDGTTAGITIDVTSATANAVYNTSVSGQTFFPDATFDYCNVTFAYSHNGKDDKVLLEYWLPSPDNFKNRYLSTGGMAYAINGGTSNLPGGVMYGAVAGITDGGFGGFDTSWDAVFLKSNGSINWDSVYMIGYQGIGEMTTIGKDFTKQFYNMSDSKLYTYYQGCSEGGREGWSQIQKYGDVYDGVIPGAPAFRYGQQQVNHLFSNVVEQTLNYYPPSCELDKIVNETIFNCDALDGRSDGVVSRSDLCMLNFNLTSIIGLPYSCAASTSSGFGLGYGKNKRQFGGGSSTPAQNGTVSAEGVAVAQTIIEGLHDSKGKRAYISYQIGAEFEDAATTYDSTTDTWGLSIASTGGEWVARFLELLDEDNLSTLNNVTYDTLKDWMVEGWYRYADSLQTANPDLSDFQSNGGKILTFHGESDPSIPAGSSVHFYESVRSVMYPSLAFNDSTTELGDWYRLFLVPGAAHCASNDLQPNGPFPQTNLQVLINWVENGTVPTTLDATYPQGIYQGQDAQICAWPLRPYYINNGSTLECQYDQASIDTWLYDFNAYNLPLY